MSPEQYRNELSPWNSYETGLFRKPDAMEVREVLAEAEISQARAAAICGVTERTIRRYCDPTDYDMPYAEWMILLYHCDYDLGTPSILLTPMATDPEDDDETGETF